MKKPVIIAAIVAFAVGGSLLVWKAGEDKSEDGMSSKSAKQKTALKSTLEFEQGTQNRLKRESVKQWTWIPEEPLNSLYAGGVEVTVAFEFDTSPELKNAITYDLNLVFGHLKSHEYLDARGAPDLLLEGTLQPPDRFLKFIGKGRYFPAEFTGKVGFMKGEKMVIPASVIQAYEEAWERKVENEDKYSSLLSAIDQLNKLSKDSIRNPNDWFFISSDAQASGIALPDLTERQFKENFGGYIYRQPSLLDIFDGIKWDSELAGKLIAKVYVFDIEGSISNSLPPLIYENGSWRFFVGKSPT